MKTLLIASSILLGSALWILANDSDEPKWQYSQGSDPMGRGVRKEAMVMSTNFVDFRFPYNGPQQAKLEIWTLPTNRKQVQLDVERGQFLFRYSNALGACQDLTVRFDDGALQEFTGLQANDGRTTSIGMLGTDNDKFIAQLRKAKKVKIEATFFQEGTVVFEFDVHGLEAK